MEILWSVEMKTGDTKRNCKKNKKKKKRNGGNGY